MRRKDANTLWHEFFAKKTLFARFMIDCSAFGNFPIHNVIYLREGDELCGLTVDITNDLYINFAVAVPNISDLCRADLEEDSEDLEEFN